MDPLIRHAITPLAFDRTKVHRARLVDQIHQNIPKKLIIVAAPPGYGKSTLLADFNVHTDLAVCWLRATPAEQDVMRLGEVLAASLQKRFRRLRNAIDLGALAGATPEALANAFFELIETRLSEPFVLAIDDVHHLHTSEPSMRFLDQLLTDLPEHMTVLAAGREVMEVSLAKLMAESDLAGIGQNDLALTREEVIELASLQSERELAAEEINQLLNESQGWVTGVVMSGRLNRTGLDFGFPETRPIVYEYLASVVLNRQPDALRRFALDSSVLQVMTAEACDEVLEREDSHRFLTRMVRMNLFLTATESTPRSYHYHPQFREFLLDSLGTADPSRLKTLRIRAASYLTQQGAFENAVELFLEAGSSGRAAKIAERQAQPLLRRGRIQTLTRWAEVFATTGAKIPNILLSLATAATDRGDLELAKEQLEGAEAMIGDRTKLSIKTRAKNIRGSLAFLRGEYETVLILAEEVEAMLGRRKDNINLAMSLRLRAKAVAARDRDFRQAEQLTSKVVGLLRQEEELYSLAAALVDLSTYQTQLGKSHEAYATGMRALGIFQKIGAPLPLAVAYNNMAVDSVTRGEYEAALRLFAKALKSARVAASPSKESNTLMGQADLFNDLGLSLQAAELYGQGLTLATQHNLRHLIQYGCLQTSILHRRQGGYRLAHEWLRRAVTVTDTLAAPSFTTSIQLAALESYSHPDKARSTLKRMLEDQPDRLEAAERTQAYYFLAVAAYRSGKKEEAVPELKRVLSSAGTHGTEQYIAAEVWHDPDILNFLQSQLRGDPVLEVVLNRVHRMQVVAHQYRDPEVVQERADRFEVISLGTSKLLLEGDEIVDLKPLAREVLFYLIDRERVHRDQLLEAFWPRTTPGRQVSNLHTAVYSIRRALGKEAVVYDGVVYRLSPEIPVAYDALDFERTGDVAERLPTGDPRRMFALTEAIHTYGGPFLPDVTTDWVLERRRSLELRYLDLLEAYSEEALVRNLPARAVQTLRQALDIDPFRDEINYHYLEALGQLGRRSEIVSHYKKYVDLLSFELGLDPPEQVRNLYGRLIG